MKQGNRNSFLENPYWKTGKILAIKIEGGLKPKTQYDISLGIPDQCQLWTISAVCSR